MRQLRRAAAAAAAAAASAAAAVVPVHATPWLAVAVAVVVRASLLLSASSLAAEV